MRSCVILSTLLVASFAQRPTYVKRPVGFPEITTVADLSNRFGDDDLTTERLPIEAYGDRDLVARLSKLPIDKQPFWFINWKHAEELRKNPQSYPQRENPFIDPASSGTSNGQTAQGGQISNRNLGDNENPISQQTQNLDMLNQMQQNQMYQQMMQNQQRKLQNEFMQNYEVPDQSPRGRKYRTLRY